MNSIVTEKDRLILKNIGSAEIASRGRRFGGHLITRITYSVLVLLSAAVFDYLEFEVFFAIAISALLLMFLHLLILYFKHQTIGMMLVGTKIVSDGTKKFSIAKVIFWRLLLEWMLPFIPVVGLVALFDYLNITGNSTNRCIHDELSNSIVVKVPT